MSDKDPADILVLILIGAFLAFVAYAVICSRGQEKEYKDNHKE